MSYVPPGTEHFETEDWCRGLYSGHAEPRPATLATHTAGIVTIVKLDDPVSHCYDPVCEECYLAWLERGGFEPCRRWLEERGYLKYTLSTPIEYVAHTVYLSLGPWFDWTDEEIVAALREEMPTTHGQCPYVLPSRWDDSYSFCAERDRHDGPHRVSNGPLDTPQHRWVLPSPRFAP